MTTLENELNKIIEDFWFPKTRVGTHNPAVGTYPPYNIIRVSEKETVLELAIAGFKETEITVAVEKNTLTIKGNKDNSDIANYLYKGIGARNFVKNFKLTTGATVTKAECADGILAVHVEYEVPEEEKPKTIPISRGERIYLTERDDIV